MLMFLIAFFVAGGAGTFFTQVWEVVVARVIIGPGDVDAGSAGNVDLNGEGLFTLINRSRHIRALAIVARFAIAAIARGNGIAVRAGFWMAEKSADALIEFGADDVFELAGLRVGFGIVDSESVFKKALGETVPANHVASATAASFG
jgi:hypothetical protein